jgi:parallel beta-helix repeat protein
MEIMNSKFVAYVGIGAFDLNLSNYNVIENCILHDSGDEGLYLRGCMRNRVIGGEYYNCSNGSGIADGENGSHNEYIGVHSYGNTGSNFSINSPYSKLTDCISENGVANNGITLGHPGSPASYSVVSGCTVKGNTNGIRVLGTSIGVIISDNVVIDNNTTNAIGIGLSDSSKDCIVSDNYLFNNYFGIFISTATFGNTIKGNIVKNSKVTGITLNATNNTIVSNNLCENNALNGTGYGIYISTTSRDNIITGNRCFDSQATKTQQRGVYSDGTKNVISNNILHGNSVVSLTANTGNFLSKNILSSTDDTKVSVTLGAGTSTVVSNGNIIAVTELSFQPTSANAITRGVYKSAQAAGSVTFTHTSGGAADTIELNII